MKLQYFIGIDIAKRKHQAAIIDTDGNLIGKSFSFENSMQGLEKFLATVSMRATLKESSVGFEATGHYWRPLYHAFKNRGIEPTVINPVQTKAFAKLELRKVKSDTVDAYHIAQALRFGKFSATYVPDGSIYALRRLTRLRYFLIDLRTVLAEHTYDCLDIVFPEYESLFANCFRPASTKLLNQYTTPAEMIAAGPDRIAAILKSGSCGKLGAQKASLIIEQAQHSFGVPDDEGVHKTEMLSSIRLMEQFASEIKLLEARIAGIVDTIPQHLTTIPGVGNVTAAAILAEVGDIKRFPTPNQLVAFAGLDPSVYQTGEFLGNHAHISKRGSPHLRRALYLAAGISRRHSKDLQAFYQRKITEGKHVNLAITAVARKLCHVVWRIMTDNRPYVE